MIIFMGSGVLTVMNNKVMVFLDVMSLERHIDTNVLKESAASIFRVQEVLLLSTRLHSITYWKVVFSGTVTDTITVSVNILFKFVCIFSQYYITCTHGEKFSIYLL
jgi:hypothetical protein